MVRITGNNQPHGYSWESKCGGLARMFHPQNAFDGSTYGTISTLYYRTTPKTRTRSLTFDEDLSLGLTVIEDVNLSKEQYDYVQEMKAMKRADKIHEKYDDLLKGYIDLINSPQYIAISDPNILANNNEYKELVDFCKTNKGSLFYKIIEDSFSEEPLKSELACYLFVGLTIADYKTIMVEVKEDRLKMAYNEEGAYIAPSPLSNIKNYIKRILSKQNAAVFGTKGAADTAIDVGTNNDMTMSVYPNPANESSVVRFALDEAQHVTIMLYDLNGRLVKTIANNRFNSGYHEIPLNISNIKDNVYICTMKYGNITITRKIFVEFN